MVKRSGGLGKALARGLLGTLVRLYRVSGGKIGGRMYGAPVLLLTTNGRRTGRPWTVPLMYQPTDDGWVLIASNGGSPRHPAWWLNLRAHPDASVQIGRETHAITGAEVTGEEREHLWRRMADMYKGYDGYARKTDRTIPVVVAHRR